MRSEDSEIAGYIEGLLDHQRGCDSAKCDTCAVLSGILDGVRQRMFTSAEYTSPGSPSAAGDPAKPVQPVQRRASR